MKAYMKPSLNWLFAFIPASVVLDRAGDVAPPMVFFSAALAIIPIAALIVRSTEQVAARTGDAVGGLLNATFGNAPELIISIVALRAGLLDMVRASLIGAILANLLLGLGLGLLLAGRRHHDLSYNPAGARAYSSMMLLAVISFSLPSAFSRFFAPDSTIAAESSLNLGIAFTLLVLYALYLVFSLKTHRGVFASADSESSGHEVPSSSLPRAVGFLIGASVLAAWMSEILVGAAEGTGEALGMSAVFIGLVFVAIVGGAAEIGSAIAMASKNKMDLATSIALGSCIQIALFVAPMLVLVSYFVGSHPLELAFNRVETGFLFVSVLLGGLVIGDGQGNWFKGVQLLTLYLIMAIVLYFIPSAH
jgi:Ca2+:H+ antiporter